MASPQAGWYEANRRAACDAAAVPRALFPSALERGPAAALLASTAQIESALALARDGRAFRTYGALADSVLRASSRPPAIGRAAQPGRGLWPRPRVHHPWQAPPASGARRRQKDAPQSLLDRSCRRQTVDEASGLPARYRR